MAILGKLLLLTFVSGAVTLGVIIKLLIDAFKNLLHKIFGNEEDE